MGREIFMEINQKDGVEPYWEFWFEYEERKYLRGSATEWFCVSSIDGEYWAMIPEDWTHGDVKSTKAMGYFLKNYKQLHGE